MTDLEPPLNNQSSTQQQLQLSSNIEEDYDGGNSTARLFERTRIQVLAGLFYNQAFIRFFLFKF